MASRSDCFCITALTSNVVVGLQQIGTTDWTGQYSRNGGTWYTWSISQGLTITLSNVGDKIFFKGTASNLSNSNYLYFSISNSASASGNIMSLVSGDNFANVTTIPTSYCFHSLFGYRANALSDVSDLLLPATTLTPYCYTQMFYNTAITTAPALPATTLAEGCYNEMFQSCEYLTATPALPATTLATKCYRQMFSYCEGLTTVNTISATTLASYSCDNMFDHCISLVNPPTLNFTSLAEYCCEGMFNMCTSLTSAPALPLTTLVEGCYEGMFSYCRALATAPVLPAITLANFCYREMFSNCIALITPPELPATTLAEYCYWEMFKSCTSLTSTPILAATTLTAGCYLDMFNGCTSLTTPVELSATTLTDYCYNGMFEYCSGIKLSATRVSNYQTPYRIPSEGTGTIGSQSLVDMFASTGGTFTGNPSINTTYYLWRGSVFTDALAFKSASGTSTVTLTKVGNPSVSDTLYSTDNGATWNTYTFGTSVSLSGDNKVLFRNTITGNFSTSNYLQFNMTGSVDLSGNIYSMYDGMDYNIVTALTHAYCFYRLFKDCTALNGLPVTLSATTLSAHCYEEIFSGCTQVKVSEHATEYYLGQYRIPSTGTGTAGTDALKNMFVGTSGLFTGTPAINTVIYTYTGQPPTPTPTSPSINKTSSAWQVVKNGVTTNFFVPSSGIKIEHENVAGSDSGRTQDGIMHIDWVRRDVVKLNLEWKAMTQSELNTLISLLQGQEFTFKFPDRGEIKTISAYCGKCSYNLYTTNYRGLGEAIYTDISINIIEI